MVPLVNPVTVQVVAAASVVQVMSPGLEVTVYPVMVAPPLNGAVHDTTDWVLALEVAVTPVGAFGVVAGVAVADGAEAARFRPSWWRSP